MYLHKSYKKMVERLEQDGWKVSITQKKNNILVLEKDGIKFQRTLAITPSTQRSIIKGIASFRRELRKRGYTTLDNFTARLMTLHEVEQIINAAAEKLQHDNDINHHAATDDHVDILAAIASISDVCLENDRVSEKAHNTYYSQKTKRR